MEQQRNEVISMLKSCLVSTKGRVSLRQLDKDYVTLIGSRIPYSKLGFKKLEDLIQSDGSFYLTKQNGEVFVDAVSSKSSHISAMVNKQRVDKRKGKIPKSVTFKDSRPAAETTRWRPKYISNKPKQFSTSTRPAAVSHNQFVSSPKHKILNLDEQNSNKPTNQPKKYDLRSRLNVEETIPKLKRSLSQPTAPISLIDDKCSSLVSTKKRIIRKMSELSMERDSGNSSPTNDTNLPVASTSPPVNDFVTTDNPISDLKEFALLHNLGTVEVSSNKVKKHKFCMCKITIGKHSFTSYPQEFSDPGSAEKYCSEKALKELIPKYTKRRSLLLSSSIDVLERVTLMLEKHNNGLWSWQLELDYADAYGEQLPPDWMQVVDTSPCVQLEQCSNNFVIRHCKPGEKGVKHSHEGRNIKDVSIPSNTIHFDKDGRLCAEVTCAVSANEIWCQQKETEDWNKFNLMMNNLDLYYNARGDQMKAETITEAGYYVSKYDNSWYRIRAVSVSDKQVQCFFIDFGDETTVPLEDIYQLEREFATCQAQAFVCRLAGLEELYDVSVQSEILQNTILFKDFILEMAVENNDEFTNEVSMAVYMYDYDTGESVNQKLIPLLSMELASPILRKDAITEVFISNIENNGDVYVQIHSQGYNTLIEQLTSLENQIIANPPLDSLIPVTKETSNNRLFLAQYKADTHWYRAKLIDWSPKGDMAQIYFVDFGNADVIHLKKEKLYPLDKLSDVLNQYPFQAVKVRMFEKNVPKNFKELAEQEMPCDCPVLLKIMSFDNDDVPWVEFFKRNSDGGLLCINKSIEMKERMKQEDGNNNVKTRRKLDLSKYGGINKIVPSGGSLPSPELPNKEEYLDVHVPFAVNPWNFFVQPLKSSLDLNEMMRKLQEKYKDVQYSPLQTEDIVPGKIYASKHDDGNWYRTSVIKVINSGSISVFYCDFGYYANLTVQQLIPLDFEFMKLPYQALKAKLGDIKPRQSKWTMEDCEIFKKMVEKRSFISILLDKEKDELYKSDIVLKLALIDTSSDEDLYVGKELTKKGVAISI